METKLYWKDVIFISAKPPEYKKLKVAAYCKAITLNRAQRESLQSQVEYYTNVISENLATKLKKLFDILTINHIKI